MRSLDNDFECSDPLKLQIYSSNVAGPTKSFFATRNDKFATI